MRITVIESPNIPTVGVGEATTVSMHLTLAQLRLDERDFIKRCNGSFKGAVRFHNWDHDADGNPTTFWHPFDGPAHLHGFNQALYYNRYRKKGGQPPFAESVTPSLAAVQQCRGPRQFEGRDYDGRYPYAYHLDASLFAGVMSGYATSLGVEHVLDDVVKVNLDERGFVKSLDLKEQGEWPIEFVIDCTGFRGLIIKEALGEPFISYSDWLLCDKAIPIQIPYGEDEHRIEPFTSSTGLDCGWSWNVPLYTRRGTGYVFSSAFATDDEALTEFRRYLKLSDDHPDPRVINMRIGRSRRSWVKNCLAAGLSGGFIEPLEATSIHFTQMALRWFVDFMPDKAVSPVLADTYNKLLEGLYEEIRDFIMLHYRTSNRDDTPFWRAARNDMKLPDSLAEKLELWKVKTPGNLECNKSFSMFENWNYAMVLAGKGYFDDLELANEATLSDADWIAQCRKVTEKRNRLLAELPDHYDLLTQIRAGSYTPWYDPEPAVAATSQGRPEAAGDGGTVPMPSAIA
jgi:tryptophan halogenase